MACFVVLVIYLWRNQHEELEVEELMAVVTEAPELPRRSPRPSFKGSSHSGGQRALGGALLGSLQSRLYSDDLEKSLPSSAAGARRSHDSSSGDKGSEAADRAESLSSNSRMDTSVLVLDGGASAAASTAALSTLSALGN